MVSNKIYIGNKFDQILQDVQKRSKFCKIAIIVEKSKNAEDYFPLVKLLRSNGYVVKIFEVELPLKSFVDLNKGLEGFHIAVCYGSFCKVTELSKWVLDVPLFVVVDEFTKCKNAQIYKLAELNLLLFNAYYLSKNLDINQVLYIAECLDNAHIALFKALSGTSKQQETTLSKLTDAKIMLHRLLPKVRPLSLDRAEIFLLTGYVWDVLDACLKADFLDLFTPKGYVALHQDDATHTKNSKNTLQHLVRVNKNNYKILFNLLEKDQNFSSIYARFIKPTTLKKHISYVALNTKGLLNTMYNMGKLNTIINV